MRILLWHVHGSWTTAFVQGEHTYLCRSLPDRGPDGRGRARTWTGRSPRSEVRRARRCATRTFDVVVLQRPHELELAERGSAPRPGATSPRSTSSTTRRRAGSPSMRHPVADRRRPPLVHVTHFNELFWDAGTTPTRVIEHGIVDPASATRGELARAAVVINEAAPPRAGHRHRPARRASRDGGAARPVRAWTRAGRSGGIEDLPQARLHDEMARRRVYLHPIRWTSLGLSLIEAMHLGMPVVALATTEAPEAVPAGGRRGLDARRRARGRAARGSSPTRTRRASAGRAARAHALARYGLDRFLADWDALLRGGGGMRIAMVSEHASPLAALGGVDAGGQNVHVAALAARARPRRGDEVVVHTRRDDPDLPAARRARAGRRGRPRRRRPAARCPRTSCCRTWGVRRRAARRSGAPSRPTSSTPTSGCPASRRCAPRARSASRSCRPSTRSAS